MHAMEASTFELAGGMAVCGSPESLFISKCAGEAAQIALLWFTDWKRSAKAETFCLELIGNDMGITGGAPCLLIDPNYGEIIGCDIRSNLLFTNGVAAISNAAGILGNVSQGGNYLVGPFVDGQTDAGQIGTTLNDLSDPSAILDAYVTTYAYPLWKFRIGNNVLSQGPTPNSLAGSQFDQFEQTFNSNANPSNRYGRGLAHTEIASGTATFVIPVISSAVVSGAGVFVAEVCGQWQGNQAKSVYYKIRQQFQVNASGTASLLSSPSTLDSDTSIDATFVAPVLSTTGTSLAVTVKEHPTQATTWVIRGYIIEGMT